ncbi:MAG: heme ABC transporter permease, partial [Gammaproteobacteria bacterium]
ATFKLTEAPSLPPELWVPLLVNVLGIYCLFGANLIGRLRLEILRRERGTQWVRSVIAEGP